MCAMRWNNSWIQRKMPLLWFYKFFVYCCETIKRWLWENFNRWFNWIRYFSWIISWFSRIHNCLYFKWQQRKWKNNNWNRYWNWHSMFACNSYKCFNYGFNLKSSFKELMLVWHQFAYFAINVINRDVYPLAQLCESSRIYLFWFDRREFCEFLNRFSNDGVDVITDAVSLKQFISVSFHILSSVRLFFF